MEQQMVPNRNRRTSRLYTVTLLFNFFAEYIMWNAQLDEAQAEIKTAEGNISNLRYADDTTLVTESKEELKSLLIKVKGKSEKAGLNSTFRKLRSWHPVPSLHGKQMGKQCKQWQTLFWGLQKSLQVATVAMKLKDACSYDKPRQHIKKQRYYFADKGPYSPTYGFSSIHVWMWEFDHKEGWALKNWCFWIAMLESPLDCKINPVDLKGNQSWIFIGRTDAEAEAPILWPLTTKNHLLGRDPDAGKN